MLPDMTHEVSSSPVGKRGGRGANKVVAEVVDHTDDSAQSAEDHEHNTQSKDFGSALLAEAATVNSVNSAINHSVHTKTEELVMETGDVVDVTTNTGAKNVELINISKSNNVSETQTDIKDNKPAVNGKQNVDSKVESSSAEGGIDLVKPSSSGVDEEEDEKETEEQKLERFQKGWRKSEAGELTVAELYLMFGSPEKVILQYEWVDLVQTQDVLQLNQNLTNMLRRLVHLATTEFADFRKSKPSKNTVNQDQVRLVDVFVT